MLDQMEFAKRLRGLARRSDTFGKDRQDILEEIVMMAEHYEAWAERIELAQIVEHQQQWEKDMILAEDCGVEVAA
jgi:hypothetical protein